MAAKLLFSINFAAKLLNPGFADVFLLIISDTFQSSLPYLPLKGVINIDVSFTGQYGLDIYTRERGGPTTIQQNGSTEKEKHLLTHCCKYLINSSKRN